MEAGMKRVIVTLLSLLTTSALFAAGTLTALTSGSAPMQIRDHVVNVVIDNGFARTEVVQTFFNPNDKDLEAVYGFPVPTSASLAEITIWNRERTLNGEVIEAEEAKKVYAEERDSGNDAGLGECSCTKKKDDVEYNAYKFSVSPVRAQSETKIRFVYYQPLTIDSGMGRYVYPLQEGGTDGAADAFWSRNPKSNSTSPSTSSCDRDGRLMKCARPARTMPKSPSSPPDITRSSSIVRQATSVTISFSTTVWRRTFPAASS